MSVQVGRDFTVYYATGGDAHGLYEHDFASGIQIGHVNLLSYTAEQNVEVYHGVGKREGWGIKAGAYDVTAHLEGLWIDSGAVQFFIGETTDTGALTSFAIGFSGTDRGMTFSGCRVGTFDAEINAEGWATATVDIPALTLK
jgi:hypothetical protein